MLHACQFCLAERRQPFGGCCYYCGSHLVTNLSRPGLINDLSPRYKDHLWFRTTSLLIWLKEDSRNLRYRLRPNWNLVLQSTSSAENKSHFKDLGRRGRLPVRSELGPVRSGVHFSATLPSWAAQRVSFLFSPDVFVAPVLEARVELDLRRLRQVLPPVHLEAARTLQPLRRPRYYFLFWGCWTNLLKSFSVNHRLPIMI